MGNVVKRAVSLPKELANQVQDVAHSQHVSYSGLIREALIRYFQDLRDRELEQIYEKYYSKPENGKAEKEAVKDFSKLSAKVWPEH